MLCPQCQAEIADGSKFCNECGSNISAVSKQSGTEPGARDLSLGNQATLGPGAHAPRNAVADQAAGMPLTDRYELLEELGRGGFAVVWKARDKKLDRIVAVKRLQLDTRQGHEAQQTLERFRREARAIAGLSHRNIAAVYDCGIDAEGDYIVMEYISGGSLADHLKANGGRLPVTDAARLARGIAEGLAYAHRKNLVHRDIKPENILLLPTETGAMIPKILDFGLVRMGVDSETSVSGYGLGTHYYMPPEQRRDAKSVNHTADIYALGKTLYEMVSGEIPDTIDPDKIPPPPELAQVIFKCVKTKPEERYFSADELVVALGRISGDSPVVPPAATGAKVTNACPACGRSNPETARFCEGCGVETGRSMAAQATEIVYVPSRSRLQGPGDIATQPVPSSSNVRAIRKSAFARNSGQSLASGMIPAAAAKPTPVAKSLEARRRTWSVPLVAGLACLVVFSGIGIGWALHHRRAPEMITTVAKDTPPAAAKPPSIATAPAAPRNEPVVKTPSPLAPAQLSAPPGPAKIAPTPIVVAQNESPATAAPKAEPVPVEAAPQTDPAQDAAERSLTAAVKVAFAAPKDRRALEPLVQLAPKLRDSVALEPFSFAIALGYRATGQKDMWRAQRDLLKKKFPEPDKFSEPLSDTNLSSPCATCLGTGGTLCDVCKGTGLCTNSKCDGGQITHLKMGNKSEKVQCPLCKGTEQCRNCGDTGRGTKDCGDCGGTGQAVTNAAIVCSYKQMLELTANEVLAKQGKALFDNKEVAADEYEALAKQRTERFAEAKSKIQKILQDGESALIDLERKRIAGTKAVSRQTTTQITKGEFHTSIDGSDDAKMRASRIRLIQLRRWIVTDYHDYIVPVCPVAW